MTDLKLYGDDVAPTLYDSRGIKVVYSHLDGFLYIYAGGKRVGLIHIRDVAQDYIEKHRDEKDESIRM